MYIYAHIMLLILTMPLLYVPIAVAFEDAPSVYVGPCVSACLRVYVSQCMYTYTCMYICIYIYIYE